MIQFVAQLEAPLATSVNNEKKSAYLHHFLRVEAFEINLFLLLPLPMYRVGSKRLEDNTQLHHLVVNTLEMAG